MKPTTLVIVAAIIAATASIALAPALTSTAMADKPPAEVCVHNGNGDNKCTGGSSATHCERVQGKYECS